MHQLKLIRFQMNMNIFYALILAALSSAHPSITAAEYNIINIILHYMADMPLPPLHPPIVAPTINPRPSSCCPIVLH